MGFGFDPWPDRHQNEAFRFLFCETGENPSVWPMSVKKVLQCMVLFLQLTIATNVGLRYEIKC